MSEESYYEKKSTVKGDQNLLGDGDFNRLKTMPTFSRLFLSDNVLCLRPFSNSSVGSG